MKMNPLPNLGSLQERDEGCPPHLVANRAVYLGIYNGCEPRPRRLDARFRDFCPGTYQKNASGYLLK